MSDKKDNNPRLLMKVTGIQSPSGDDAVIMEFHSQDINVNISIIGTLLAELINELVATELRHEPELSQEYIKLYNNNEVIAYRALYDALIGVVLKDILVGQVGKQYLGAPAIQERLAKLELEPSKLVGNGITVLSGIVDSVKGQNDVVTTRAKTVN